MGGGGGDSKEADDDETKDEEAAVEFEIEDDVDEEDEEEAEVEYCVEGEGLPVDEASISFQEFPLCLLMFVDGTRCQIIAKIHTEETRQFRRSKEGLNPV